jgi:hypothetical protein
LDAERPTRLSDAKSKFVGKSRRLCTELLVAVVLRGESVYEPGIMSAEKLGPFTRHTASTLARLALAAALALAAEACGDDHEDTGSAVRAACNSSCQKTSGQCNLINLAPGCTELCDLGYSLAPACGAAYQNYVACAGDMPTLSCTGNTVSVSVLPCTDQLGAYLNCAVNQVLTGVCVNLPFENSACAAQNLPNRATACVGAPPNCTVLTGIAVQGGGGLGVFCCPP